MFIQARIVLGHRARHVNPVITVAGQVVPRRDGEKYVGITLSSRSPRMLSGQYPAQQSKARTASIISFAAESVTGSLPVETAIMLYKARVDPCLIGSADVCPDAIDSHVALLEKEQRRHLRRILGLGRRCATVSLFSETGLWPIRPRRALLCVDYLSYLIGRDHDSLTSAALRDSRNLHDSGLLSWYGDACAAAGKVGGHIPSMRLPTQEEIVFCKEQI